MLSNRFPHVIRLVAIILLTYLTASCDDGRGPDKLVDAAPPTAELYTLVWSDEFDVDGAPNVKNWNIEEGGGGWGNDEWQTYTDDVENLRVEGGNLVITAQCSNATTDPALCNTAGDDGTITSARITTNDKVEVKYGRIQARIKVPPGKGTWPAFWMLGADFPNTPWPRAGEIDIVEIHQFYSDINTTHTAMHWCDESIIDPVGDLNKCLSKEDAFGDRVFGRVFDEQFKKFDDINLSDDYHVYEIQWDESGVIGIIDGITYFNKSIDPATMEEFYNRFFMILNVAVGGTLGGPPNTSTTWPQEMLVDWVRVYEKTQPDVLAMVSDDQLATRPYVRFFNSGEFGGDAVAVTVQRSVSLTDDPAENPPAVTPLVGTTVIEFDYESANTFFSGAAFGLNRKDFTHYEKLVFSLDKSKFKDLNDISFEIQDYRFTGDGEPGKTSLLLSNYTPTVSGNWQTYEIPLTDFNQTNMDGVSLFGFWNPTNSSGQLVAGKLYIDDVKFVNEPCSANGSVSFNADSYLAYASSTIITVSDACLANKNKKVVVLVDNGRETIGVSALVDANGNGSATINFGPSNDASSTIELQEGDVITLTYTDTNGLGQTDTANVITPPLAVYSETLVDNVLAYTGIINENTTTEEASTVVTAEEGSVSLQADYAVPTGGENGFAFEFPDTSGGLILNGSFELPDASGGTLDCTAGAVTDWECFNPAFVFSNANGAEPGPLAFDGSQVLVTIGGDGLAQQSVAVTAGETVNASVYAMNWATNKLFDGSIAIFQLAFFDVGNNQVGVSEVKADSVGNEDYTLTQMPGTSTADWTRMDVSGVAPVGAVRAQILMLHVIGGGDPASRVFWDNVSLSLASSGQQSNDISYFKTLKFAVNKTAAGSLMDLEVRIEDAAATVATAFLSDYTPTAGGVAGWDLYEISLSNFAGLDLTDIRALGFYNASTVDKMDGAYPAYFATTLYFDNVHFVADAPEPLVGLLVDMPIEGVTFSTDSQSGISNSAGEFLYLPGEMVTFTVGDILLGTVLGAPLITPVELTGSANPTEQAAINQMVFLQSIDSDMTPSNGITISAASQAEAIGLSLDFTLGSAAFTSAISGPTGLVNIIAPGNAVVSEADAVNNFYEAFPPEGSIVTTTIDVSPGTVDADGSDISNITVQAKDSSGNNITVSAGAVTLSTTGSAVLSGVTDVGDGTYTATLTNAVAENVSITGTIAGLGIVDNASVTFVGAASLGDTSINATSPVEADNTSTSTITVQVKDGNGVNFVKSAGTVNLTITVSTTATFNNGNTTTVAIDNLDGTYTASVKNSAVEDVIIEGAIVGIGTITDDATVSFIVGAASNLNTTITAVPASAAITNGSNTSTTSTITVQAKDGGDNNLVSSGGTVTLSSVSATAIISGVLDNNDGTYTATVTNTVAENVIITGTIAGNNISDNDTSVLFANSVAVVSETNSDIALIPNGPAYSPTGCDAIIVDDNVPTSTYPSYEGSLSSTIVLPVVTTCVGSVINFGESDGNTLSSYNQNFEALDINNSLALGLAGGDLWRVFADVWDGAVGSGVFQYQYGPFTAPNGGPSFSAIATGEGGVDQGLQYINIYSDYNNADHADTGACAPNSCTLNTTVFQEPASQSLPIVAADIGGTFTFSGDYKAPSSAGIANPLSNATANAFIKTLDPNNGFATTNLITFDSTTADPVNWGSFSIEIFLTDPALAGQILQFGFNTVATNYDDSGVYYDNLSFDGRTIDLSGNATLKFALDSSAASASLIDMQVKLEDGSGGTASVYLSNTNYGPIPANVVGADWQLYEIPLADFSGTLDNTIVKKLTFLNPSSTVSDPLMSGTITPITGTLRSDDIHFIEQP